MTLEEIRICKKLANTIDTLIRNYGHNAYEYCKDKLGGTIADLLYEEGVKSKTLLIFIDRLVLGNSEQRGTGGIKLTDKEALRQLKVISDILGYMIADSERLDKEAHTKEQRAIDTQVYNQKLTQYKADLKLSKERGWETPDKPTPRPK